MLQQRSFVFKNRRGGIQKAVREHYLRDDIPCGVLTCPSAAADPASPCKVDTARLRPSGAETVLVVDTNVALHQIDLLENAAIADVVLPSIVMEEVKHKNMSVHGRLRALCADEQRRFFVFVNEHHRDTYIKAEPGESPNDRNDRAIRVAARWYAKHLGPLANVLLLTDDRANLAKAVGEGIQASTVMNYVKSLGDNNLLDLVAATVAAEAKEEAAAKADMASAAATAAETQSHMRGVAHGSKRKRIYPDHKPMSEITAGLQRGLLHQGKLRVSRYNASEAFVGSESLGDEILLVGRTHMNRAVDGDVVAVELLPREEWIEPSAGMLREGEDDEEGEGEGEEDSVGLAPTVMDDASLRYTAPSQDTSSAMVVDGGEGSEKGGKQAKKKGGAGGAAVSDLARPTGRVVGIIKRNWRPYCGALAPMRDPPAPGSVVRALFVAADRRIPRVRIETRQAGNLMGKRIVVAIDSWAPTSALPSGHYVKSIGDIGDRETESEVLLMENDIDARPFSQQVLDCLPPLPWSASEVDYRNPHREDLRKLLVVSVDPIGCKDIDDALHCHSLPNGNLEVGVHIADVTNFVLPGTPLDIEASQRGTSVYLVDRRIDMLPKPLTEDVCSLRAEVERLAFSCIWEMTPDADIVSARFTKSIIRSSAALSYVEAQARMDDSRMNDPITVSLRSLNRLAKIMRQRRNDRGALTLASPEVKFEIDTETHNPLDVGMYQVREANHMIEEFMLAANVTVAEKILQHFASCSLLRRHPVPTPKMFEPLLRTAAAVGLTIDTSTSKALADSLDEAQGPDPYFNKLIRILTTRCMTQAVYFPSGQLSPSDFYHYGLAAPLYTHFTSPIRRYADVVVHRLLAAAIGISPLPAQSKDKAALTVLTDNLNYRNRNAQMAGRASVELHTLIFFRTRPTEEEARIVMVRANGLIVFVPKYGIEGPVLLNPKETQPNSKGSANKPNPPLASPASALPGSQWVVNEREQAVQSVDGQRSFRVLDPVRVRIEVTEPEPHRPKLTLTLVE